MNAFRRSGGLACSSEIAARFGSQGASATCPLADSLATMAQVVLVAARWARKQGMA
jgi:hypothetical protein